MASVGGAHVEVAKAYGGVGYLVFFLGWTVIPALAVYHHLSGPVMNLAVVVFVWVILGLIPGLLLLVAYLILRFLLLGNEGLAFLVIVAAVGGSVPYWLPAATALAKAGT